MFVKTLGFVILLSCLGASATRADPRVTSAERAYARGNYAQAARDFLPPAREGNAKAETYLGFMFQRGLGVPKNYEEAANWLHEAALQGEPAAQFLLALLYDKGLGVPHDFVRAYVWLDLAAAHAEPRHRDYWMRMRDAVANKLSYDELARAQSEALAFTATSDR